MDHAGREGEPEDSGRGSLPARRAVVLGLVVGVPASILFLWLAFRNTSFDEVWSVARSADPWLLLLAVVALSLLYVCQAARWRRLADVERPRELGFLEMVLGAIACNNVLPGRLGELFRARWLAVAAPMPSGRALASVGLDRGCDVLALFAFLLLALPFVASAAWVTRIAVGAAILVLALLLLFAAARAYSRRRQRERHARGRLRRIARDVVDTLAEPMGRRRVARALVLSVAGWASFALVVWLVARSIGVELDPVECLFVTGVLNLGVAIPSSPGFVGTYQWLAVAAFGVLDLPREDALAFSLLLHSAWYVPTTLVGGFLAVFRLRLGKRRE
jgi:uncharacterized protein (TIRG00374 family)